MNVVRRMRLAPGTLRAQAPGDGGRASWSRATGTCNGAARLRTCVRSVDQGQTGSWLRRALESGNLASAISEAADLPALNLSDALAIVLLMAEQEHPSFDRAAAKWVARLGIERRTGLDELRVVLDAMRLLPYHPGHARSCLADVCARHELAEVVGLA
jgi:hypothetical protein